MPAFFIPGRVTRGQRPNGPYQINRDFAQSLGVVAWVPMSGQGLGYDLWRGRPQVSAVTPAFASMPQHGGVAPSFGANGALVECATVTPDFGVSGTITAGSVACWVVARSSGSGTTFGRAVTVNDGQLSLVWGGADADVIFQFGGNNETGVGVVALNKPQLLVGTALQGGNRRLYTNGVLRSSTSIPTDFGSAGALYVGNLPAANRGFDGWVSDVVIANRQWSDAEVWALYDSARFDLYWVAGRRVFFDVGAAPAFDPALFPRSYFEDLQRRRDAMIPSGRIA